MRNGSKCKMEGCKGKIQKETSLKCCTCDTEIIKTRAKTVIALPNYCDIDLIRNVIDCMRRNKKDYYIICEDEKQQLRYYNIAYQIIKNAHIYHVTDVKAVSIFFWYQENRLYFVVRGIKNNKNRCKNNQKNM